MLAKQTGNEVTIGFAQIHNLFSQFPRIIRINDIRPEFSEYGCLGRRSGIVRYKHVRQRRNTYLSWYHHLAKTSLLNRSPKEQFS